MIQEMHFIINKEQPFKIKHYKVKAYSGASFKTACDYGEQ